VAIFVKRGTGAKLRHPLVRVGQQESLLSFLEDRFQV